MNGTDLHSHQRRDNHYDKRRDGLWTGLHRNNPAGNYVLGSDIDGFLETGPIIGAIQPVHGQLQWFRPHDRLLRADGDGIVRHYRQRGTVSNMGISPPLSPSPQWRNTVPAVGILANYNQGDIINTFASGQ